MSTKTFEQFASSIGLGKKQYEGIRKDLLSSPKFLTEIAYPLAKQQGRMEEFLKSLEAIQTAWGTFNFRSAFESWMKTGNASALNKAFESAFGVSQALQQNLPDWRNALAASGVGGSEDRRRLPINRPITGAPSGSTTPTSATQQPPVQIVFAPQVTSWDSSDVREAMRDDIFPEFLDMLKNNTADSRRQLIQVLT
jgi:hypothetical protein